VLLLTAGLSGQSVSAYRDPVDLVRKAVQNEIKASNDDSAHFLFRAPDHAERVTTKMYVETNDATAAWSSPTTANPLTPDSGGRRGARRAFRD